MAVQRHRHSVRMYGAIAGAGAVPWRVHNACMVAWYGCLLSWNAFKIFLSVYVCGCKAF